MKTDNAVSKVNLAGYQWIKGYLKNGNPFSGSLGFQVAFYLSG